ncbi:hypothetical protein [Sphingopyxis terrae]|uniref:hypothetical protein n=1 Tax=Sphingopyxis terrae TaxID=33052 RepID=UPI002A0B1DE0|nr:hypothetical protein [Sphingopyxis terrae]MDX8357145.1 hypothetical protein [Sphingopyxis terrae]
MAVAGMVSMLATASASGAGQDTSGAISDDARALIARTRETQAAYSIIASVTLYKPDGSIVGEWSAEFHDRNQHRVETPRDRIVADCAEMTGTYLDLATMKASQNAAIARAACGVQANSKILSAKVAGPRQNRFGRVDHLVVVDEENVRTYDIASDGAILGATITGRDGQKRLMMRATYYVAKAPSEIFLPSSLGRSAVPANLRRSSN